MKFTSIEEIKNYFISQIQVSDGLVDTMKSYSNQLKKYLETLDIDNSFYNTFVLIDDQFEIMKMVDMDKYLKGDKEERDIFLGAYEKMWSELRKVENILLSIS